MWYFTHSKPIVIRKDRRGTLFAAIHHSDGAIIKYFVIPGTAGKYPAAVGKIKAILNTSGLIAAYIM